MWLKFRDDSLSYQAALRRPATGHFNGLLYGGLLLAAIAATALYMLNVHEWQSQSRVAPSVHIVTAADPDAAEADMGATGAPLLWHVQSKNADIWLFGVPAGAVYDRTWGDTRLFQAFDGSREAWLESGGVLEARALSLGHRVVRLPRAAAPTITDAWWRNGDERSQLAQSKSNAGDARRNAALIGQLTRRLRSGGKVFIAVEPARLIGAHGLVAQLRDNGQIVSRLDLQK